MEFKIEREPRGDLLIQVHRAYNDFMRCFGKMPSVLIMHYELHKSMEDEVVKAVNLHFGGDKHILGSVRSTFSGARIIRTEDVPVDVVEFY